MHELDGYITHLANNLYGKETIENRKKYEFILSNHTLFSYFVSFLMKQLDSKDSLHYLKCSRQFYLRVINLWLKF